MQFVPHVHGQRIDCGHVGHSFSFGTAPVHILAIVLHQSQREPFVQVGVAFHLSQDSIDPSGVEATVIDNVHLDRGLEPLPLPGQRLLLRRAHHHLQGEQVLHQQRDSRRSPHRRSVRLHLTFLLHSRRTAAGALARSRTGQHFGLPHVRDEFANYPSGSGGAQGRRGERVLDGDHALRGGQSVWQKSGYF